MTARSVLALLFAALAACRARLARLDDCPRGPVRRGRRSALAAARAGRDRERDPAEIDALREMMDCVSAVHELIW